MLFVLFTACDKSSLQFITDISVVALMSDIYAGAEKPAESFVFIGYFVFFFSPAHDFLCAEQKQHILYLCDCSYST